MFSNTAGGRLASQASDGTERTIDVGQFPHTQQSFQDLVLASDNQPWRVNCIPPALPVPGLNDGFCPGETPEGLKQLNLEQSRLVRHGVYPVQPQLEHFKCYLTRRPKRFKRRKVSLMDQFGTGSARVTDQRGLCIPVRKNRERFRNRRAHLQCYGTRLSPGFQPRRVAVRLVALARVG